MNDPMSLNLSSPVESRHPCASCQRRRVKCDRLSPCTNCITHGQECKQPDSRRAPRKPRKPTNASVLERVRQLEHTLEHLKSQTQPTAQTPATSPETRSPEPKEDDPGRLLIENNQSRYVSGSSWANVAEKMSELKGLLETDEMFENEDSPSSTSLLLSMASQTGQSPPPAPSSTLFPFLWEMYKKNVDPIMKVVHVPSMESRFSSALLNPMQSAKGTTCLMAAIKFAAVLTLTDEQCWATMNSSREALLNSFRFEVLGALDDSKFLISHDLATLQAYVIFLSCNIRHEHLRAMWISSGVAIRLAQSIGLHRDGTHMKLSIFATEIRRRLWWHIRMLDIACAEDCGLLPSHVYGEDVLLPLNINDEDISPADTTWPPERDGFTEMTYSLIRFECSSRLHGFRSENGKTSMGILTGNQEEIKTHAKSLTELRELLNTKYFRHCQHDIPLQRVTKDIGDLILSKVFCIIHYPLKNKRDLRHVSKDLIDDVIASCCNVIELSHELLENPATYPYTWQHQSYIHWHPVAFLSREICLGQMTRAQIIRAWRAITWSLNDPHTVEPAKNRLLWKPLDGVISEAKAKILELNLDVDCSGTTPPSQSSITFEPASGFEMTLEELQEWQAPANQNLFSLDINAPLMPYLPSDVTMATGNINLQNDFNISMWPGGSL